MSIKNTFPILFVLYALFFTPFAFSNQQLISDTSITTEIKAKIAQDPSLSIFEIHVKTDGGIVTLSGNVNSETEAMNLIEIAQSVDGVNDINMEALQIRESKHPMSDATITAKIKGLFIRDKLFSSKDIAAMSIRVETVNGVVYLSGTANNQQQAENAISIAKKVKGVKKVESKVEIAY